MKTETINVRVTDKLKKTLIEKAKNDCKTLSAYILYKATEEYTEWTKQDTIKTHIQIANTIYSSSQIEIPVSFLKCMPLYKWQYCHEVLKKQEGYCDADFHTFLHELQSYLTCLRRLIKLHCLETTERRKLISLFKRKLKKKEIYHNTRKEKEFLETVEQLKTIK